MDNVTHGLAGLLLADLTIATVEHRTGVPTPRGFRRAAVVLGVLGAELPDADLLYSGGVLEMGKLGYLLHHRGHTHTVLFAIGAAFALWGLVVLFRREARAEHERAPLLALALAATLSHILLDFTNSYGVHPFWPLDNHWYYGDAIFIVEPWLWLVAIPPLLFGFRRVAGRSVLAILLAGILSAAWYVDLVNNGLALLLTVFTAVWLVVMRATSTRNRLAGAFVAWMVVEAVGFGASRSARAHVHAQLPNATVLDVVLTSAPANPLCQNAIVIERDGASYDVSTATVASWPAAYSAVRCAGGTQRIAAERRPVAGLGEGLLTSPRGTSDAIVWFRRWRSPYAELQQLAVTHCEVAAALEFMRVPVWEQSADGRVNISDLRYGFGGDGFADMRFSPPSDNCPRYVPGWTPPRRDVLTLEPRSESTSAGTSAGDSSQ